MSLSLLLDPWIPVIRNGAADTIRPYQIAEPGISSISWSRPDFNLACLELLIGLISIADPPEDDAEWSTRLNRPDASRLREALEPFEQFFLLSGDGPRFLQDQEPFELTARPTDIRPVDMLFIDSAGGSTASKNADLTVKRNRFGSLAPADAAMALFTLQAFAPLGGAGNRTSMRGGGPMTTLVQPTESNDVNFPIWRLVFSNVRPGLPLPSHEAGRALPWLRPTRTSESGQVVNPEATHPLESFFGMPRRLRLRFKDDSVTGVVQKPYGTNYVAWEHPLTPYYRRKEDDAEWLPVHPKAGRLSYRNWLGVTLRSGHGEGGTRRVAANVRAYCQRPRVPDFELLVGGWAMDNMKPVDFSFAAYPGFPGLNEDAHDRVRGLVDAANIAAGSLRKALKAASLLDGTAADAVTEAFFVGTQDEFSESVRKIVAGLKEDVEIAWHKTLRNEAVRMFDERIVHDLSNHDLAAIEKRVMAKRNLLSALAKQVRKELNLPMPGKKEKRA